MRGTINQRRRTPSPRNAAGWTVGLVFAATVAALTGLPAPASAQNAPVISDPLVPAAMGIRTDQAGNSWNIEQNGSLGRVGNSLVNSGLNLLINNQQFYTYQPMMTADGKEYVLHNRQNSSIAGLEVLRRIRMMEQEGIVRYLEILSNVSANTINLNVSLRTNFSGNYKTYLTDQGNADVVMLGNRESAILVTPGSTQTNRAFVFALCSPKSQLKPSISSQNKYALTFQYNLTLAPGQTVILAHAVGQVPVPRNYDRRSLAQLFRPFQLNRLQSSIPSDLRKLVANYERSGAPGGAALLSSTSLDGLGVERLRRDVLAMGETTRLVGSASCGRLTLSSDYGDAEIPFENVAAVVGGNRGTRDVARVFLRDGQVFNGRVSAENLRFVMASGGKMNLDVSNLDRLVRGQKENEGVWEEGVVALIETFGGDRLAVYGGKDFQISAATSWGSLRFSLDDLLWLSPQEDEPVGHYIEFKDGTRCYAYLSGDTVPVYSELFGEHDLEVRQIRAVVTRASVERAEELQDRAIIEPVITQPNLRLAGNQRVVCQVITPSLKVLTGTEALLISPDEIRTMTNPLEDFASEPQGPGGPEFRIELWGGGVITGRLGDAFVPIRVRGEEWKIPVGDIVAYETPVPRLNDGARQEISELIRKLGSDDWETREVATEELNGYGYLAKAILEKELNTNPDPEVRRRIERVLSGVE